jgi:hypothetical protein
MLFNFNGIVMEVSDKHAANKASNCRTVVKGMEIRPDLTISERSNDETTSFRTNYGRSGMRL